MILKYNANSPCYLVIQSKTARFCVESPTGENY